MNKNNGCGIRDARGSERYTAGFKLGRSVLSRPLFTVYCSLITLLLLAAFAPRAEAVVVATGGTISQYITNGTKFTVHTFTAGGTFNVTSPGIVEVLVVGGGGGGGGSTGGGGGAGGLIYSNAFAVTNNGVYTVTVGAGGSGGSGSDAAATQGTNGQNSAFGTLIAYGGGGGGCNGYTPAMGYGLPGGSGGGGSVDGQFLGFRPGGSFTNGQGNTGGVAIVWGPGPNNNYPTGGGGGAGGGGSNGTLTVGGQGGVGKQYDLSGVATWYAGGGGGGCYVVTANGDYGGAGGSGAGGRGGSAGGTGITTNAPSNGAPNTGSGGGGQGGNLAASAGAGGSGIVIVRYVTLTAPYKAWGLGDVRSIVTNYNKVYAVHQYTNTAITGYFVPSTPLEKVEVIVVGGGGGGGGSTGGGGGAGGLIYSNAFAVTNNGVYTVTVGAGGSGGSGSDAAATQGTNGQNSAFGTLIAYGGGGGGCNGYTPAMGYGLPGGSGGGGSVDGQFLGFRPGGSFTNGQGNTGGVAIVWGPGPNNNYPTGGGGGAGGGGSNGTLTVGGQGGVGKQYDLSGVATWYAGGGGGGCYVVTANGDYGGAGGSGAGGRGGSAGGTGITTNAPSNGAPNTGSGGGGQGGNLAASAGAGGSGIVIVRYDITPKPKGTVFTMR
ncbi:MAG: glycine-rich domain-containing protein [Kiritimatiellia bacterium]